MGKKYKSDQSVRQHSLRETTKTMPAPYSYDLRQKAIEAVTLLNSLLRRGNREQ